MAELGGTWSCRLALVDVEVVMKLVGKSYKGCTEIGRIIDDFITFVKYR